MHEDNLPTVALEELIERRKQKRVLKAIGTFRFRSDWNYKAERRGRESGR
jgi:hypothetical protein